jgi:hypothetical protein
VPRQFRSNFSGGSSNSSACLGTAPHGDYPAVTVTLDPACLHKINWPEAEYLYELSIEDPRGVFGSDMGSKTPQMTEPSSEPILNDVREEVFEAIHLNDDRKLGGHERSVSFRRIRRLSLSGVSELVLSYRNEPLPAMIRPTQQTRNAYSKLIGDHRTEDRPRRFRGETAGS